MSLRQLERRYPHFALERTPQMALADAKLGREIGDAVAVQRPRRDALRRNLREREAAEPKKMRDAALASG